MHCKLPFVSKFRHHKSIRKIIRKIISRTIKRVIKIKTNHSLGKIAHFSKSPKTCFHIIFQLLVYISFQTKIKWYLVSVGFQNQIETKKWILLEQISIKFNCTPPSIPALKFYCSVASYNTSAKETIGNCWFSFRNFSKF